MKLALSFPGPTNANWHFETSSDRLHMDKEGIDAHIHEIYISNYSSTTFP
jgi:hypothetical protein